MPSTASVDFTGTFFEVTNATVGYTSLSLMSDESDLTILDDVVDNYIIYEYENATITNPSPVPAPLPIFATVAAFSCSRRLRRRIKCAT
jgi:hypothetical protein